MTFKEAFEHYRAGTANDAERQLVEEELEKNRLIGEYLDEQWEPVPALNTAPREEMKKVRRNLRKRNALIVLTSLILAAALLLGTVYVAIPAWERQYWNPEIFTYDEYASDLFLTMDTYSELFSPTQSVWGVYSTRTGFACYQLSVQMHNAADQGKQSYQTAALEKGALTLPMGFWDYCSVNIFDRACYPFYSLDDEGKRQIYDRLTSMANSAMSDFVLVRAAVSFPEDLDMEQLIAFEETVTDGSINWVAIRGCGDEEQLFPLCGMKPFSGGIVHNEVNESYPCFDIKGLDASAEDLENHFKALLRFSMDQVNAGTGLETVNYQGTSYYESVLGYVEENGVYAYGCYITAPPQFFLELLDSGFASQVWPEDAWINLG